MRPATGPAVPDTAMGGPLNFAGSIGSEYLIRIGDAIATPLADGAGSIESGVRRRDVDRGERGDVGRRQHLPDAVADVADAAA